MMKWLLAMVLAAVPVAAQEKADGPYAWMQFKPGSFRKVRMTMFGTTTEALLTLKEITEKELVFDKVVSSTFDKTGKASVITMPVFRPGEKIAEETLKFKGTDYKCRVMKGSYEFAGMKTEGRYWLAEGVEFPLKTIEVGSGAESWMNLETESRLVDLDEELTIARRKLKCARYEGSSKGAQIGTVTMWVCAEIPGGMARAEVEMETATGKLNMVMETVEFEGKK